MQPSFLVLYEGLEDKLKSVDGDEREGVEQEGFEEIGTDFRVALETKEGEVQGRVDMV
jgi:hypothetical protein